MKFSEVNLDDEFIESESKSSCSFCLKNLYGDNDNYREFFEDYKLEQLQSKLVRVAYVKNIIVKDLSDHFEQPTDYLFHCTRYVYVINEDSEVEHLATYILVLDENMNIVDDYLF